MRMAQLVAEHDEEATAAEDEARERRDRGVTVRELAAEWLDYLEREKGVKPSTLLDYRCLLTEPGTPRKRGGGHNPGRIMGALGVLRLRSVTTKHVATFLRGLDRDGMSGRSVNKHRQLLSAMFGYACREDTYALAVNPVSGISKRRELPATVLDYYEPDEIEALAGAAQAGGHRRPPGGELSDDERAWRAWEDSQDGELYRVAAYTGLRLGELLALRWEDVDLDARRVIVHRAVSAGVEGPTKSWQARFVPLADSAAAAFARLAARDAYTSRDDYVICSRLGRRLDGSALRRRYNAGRRAAGLRPLRFHARRHSAGSLAVREAGAHFVQAFLGHSRVSTTERYLHARGRRALRAGVPRPLARVDDGALPARESAATGRRTSQSRVRGTPCQHGRMSAWLR
jgi:integrase